MKKLDLEKMEKIEGGNVATYFHCVAVMIDAGMPTGLSFELCAYSEGHPIN